MPWKPNNSKLKNKDVNGQLVTPQKTLIKPIPAQKEGEREIFIFEF